MRQPTTNIVSGRQLRAARVLAGLTQAQLAQQAGFHERACRYWEARGDDPPTTTPSSLAKIEAALGRNGVAVLLHPPAPPGHLFCRPHRRRAAGASGGGCRNSNQHTRLKRPDISAEEAHIPSLEPRREAWQGVRGLSLDTGQMHAGNGQVPRHKVRLMTYKSARRT